MDNPTAIKLLNEHILEIRYKPNAHIFDYRGDLAESISKHMSVSEWRIGQNRVDVYDKDQLTRFFVSFRNAGAVIRNTPLPDYFPNHASKFLRHLFSLEPLVDPVRVERLGVRSRFAAPSSMMFEVLLEKYCQCIIAPTQVANEVFDAKLIDIGGSLNFETKSGWINSNSGPMEKTQLVRYFDFVEQERLPEAALYVEFDYWLKPSREVPLKEIVACVKLYAQENWQRYDRIRTLVMGS